MLFMTMRVKKFLAVALLGGFIVWIIPLGAFIQAQQEGVICNGRRAVCLCTQKYQKNRKEPARLTFRQAKRQAEPSIDAPTFGGQMLVSGITELFPPSEQLCLTRAPHVVCITQPSLPPEPVPKVG